MGRASKDKRDMYYRKAKEEGYRARSAYKLLHINSEFNLLNVQDIKTGVVDLCSAPGSWSQVLAKFVREMKAQVNFPRIIAVDLQEMAPIDGVTFIQGDITSEATAKQIISLLNTPQSDKTNINKTENDEENQNINFEDQYSIKEELELKEKQNIVKEDKLNKENKKDEISVNKADLVICDGAPDVTGMHELDEYLQHQLLLAALTITTSILRSGGCFLTKMFRGPATSFLVAKAECFFKSVRIVKPPSSRNASLESFMLCQEFTLPMHYIPRFITSTSTTITDSNQMEKTENLKNCSNNERNEIIDLNIESPHYVPEAPHVHYTCNEQMRDCNAERVLLPFIRCGDLNGYNYWTQHNYWNNSTLNNRNNNNKEVLSYIKQNMCKWQDNTQTNETYNEPKGNSDNNNNKNNIKIMISNDNMMYDADMCYDREPEAPVLAPIHPPIQAPYLSHLHNKCNGDDNNREEACETELKKPRME